MLREAVRVTGSGGLLFFRDLMRPADLQQLDALVQTHVGDENEQQQTMFRDSLKAALNVNEMRAAVQ